MPHPPRLSRSQILNDGLSWRFHAVWGLLLFALCAPVRAEQPLVTVDLLTKLESAANHKDITALKALSVPNSEDPFAWATQPQGMIGQRLSWQAKRLTLPGIDRREEATFIAFSKYHPCESAGDHLYRVGFTPQGVRLREEVPETDTLGTRVRDHKLAVRFDVPHRHVYITDHVTVER